MMQVSTERYEGMPLVVVRGEIDHGSSGSLQTTIDAAIEGGFPVVLLDLNDVTYIDSGGISVLLSTVRRLRNDGWLAAIGPNPNVRRLFEIVGLKFDAGFRVFDTRADAVRAVGGMTPS
jgi:anti-anti-sigma factor